MLISILGTLLALAVFVSPAAAQDRQIEIREPSHVPQCQQGPIIINPCPGNQLLVIFDQPVYDEDGLFVICFKKVPYCVPPNRVPEG